MHIFYVYTHLSFLEAHDSLLNLSHVINFQCHYIKTCMLLVLLLLVLLQFLSLFLCIMEKKEEKEETFSVLCWVVE